MGKLRSWQKRVRGWFPQEPRLAFAAKAAKPRWRRPAWVALTLVAVVALAFVAYTGVRTYIRYSNPQADVTAAYFEKSLNSTTAKVGDTVVVTFRVGWHGYALPECRRQVEIVDPYPQDAFKLVDGNNTIKYSGYGGSDQYSYLLKVTGNSEGAVELPKPKLYLDNTEIALLGSTEGLEVTIPK